MTATPRPAAIPGALESPLDAFLDELRTGRRLSPRTVDAYGRDLADYARFASRQGLGRWDDVTGTLVDGYLASLVRRGLSSATVARRRAALRGFHAHRARLTGLAADPVADLPPARRERKLPHALSVDDIERLLAHPEGEGVLALRDRALFELAYGSGLRVSELTGLTRDRLDLGAQTVSVAGKGNKERQVPFGRAARRALDRYLERARPALCARTRHDVVFANARGGPLSRMGFWKILRGHPRGPRLPPPLHPPPPGP